MHVGHDVLRARRGRLGRHAYRGSKLNEPQGELQMTSYVSHRNEFEPIKDGEETLSGPL